MLYHILPSSEIDNGNNETLLNNLNFYDGFKNRLHIKEKKLESQNNISFEIYLEKNNVNFYINVPDKFACNVPSMINSVWGNSEVIPMDTFSSKDPTNNIVMNKATHLVLEHHYFFSLKVDKRGYSPLPQILETTRLLRPGEKAVVQIFMQPCERSWYVAMENAYNEFSQGHVPKKILRDSSLSMAVSKALYYTIMETLNLVSIFFSNKEYTYENLDKIAYNSFYRTGLSINTRNKAKATTAYDTSVRIGVQCNENADAVIDSLVKAFNVVSQDNKLIKEPYNDDKVIKCIMDRKPIIHINKNILSTPELAQLVTMPTKMYQDIYNIRNVSTIQKDIPAVFTKGGILFGQNEFRNEILPINIPIDDHDSLCQTWLNIGKMGSGKTTNGENLAVQLLKSGFSVFAFDVADGDLITHIENRLPKDFDKIIDLDFGDTDNPIALNWSEIGTSEDKAMETKIASQLKNFLNKLAKSETSDRMERYLGACAKAVYKNPDNNLLDVILCITSMEYRHKIIEDNHIEGRLKYTLEQMDDTKAGKTKDSFITGIMDRLDAILDNDYVANCLLQRVNKDINFRKWADEGYFVGIRVPKDKLLDDATDLLVTYIVSKLWLAILTRSDTPKEKRRPCFAILDEPHQFPTVLQELFTIIREMRKWRFGLIIMAHEFDDFKFMKTLLKNAGVNYFIYNTSVETYKSLIDELSPYKLDDCVNTKYRHAIVCAHYKQHRLITMAQMMAPLPDIRKYERVNKFGRPLLEVEEDIFEKTKNFM